MGNGVAERVWFDLVGSGVTRVWVVMGAGAGVAAADVREGSGDHPSEHAPAGAGG